MNIPKLLEQLDHAPIRRDLNYMMIPVTTFNFNEDGIEQFNNLYSELLEACRNWNKIVRTKSGGVSVDKKNFRPPMWDTRRLKSTVELTIVGFCNMWRIQVRTSLGSKQKDKPRYGRQSFNTFKNICKKFGVDIEDLAVDNGYEYKQQIEQPPIKLERPTFKDKIYTDVHHIDLNSSFMAGIAEANPVLREPIEYMYNMRKEIPEYKQDLVATQGFMQSEMTGFRFAHLAKAGIDSNNKKIEQIANNLKSQGFTVLLYNTDGIWYIGHGKQYHDENEGKALGQWKHDHINCTFRAKDKGAYQFIENGECFTKLRGHTKLDRIKTRDEDGKGWDWGDIYRLDAEPTDYFFVEGKGVLKYEKDTII